MLRKISAGVSQRWVILLALSAIGCSREPSAPASAAPSTEPTSSAESVAPAAPSSASASALEPKPKAIGQASMQDDKTIVLELYVPAHARMTYPPSHPEYRKVLDHIGGLEPGQEKLVPPWPDDIDDAKVEEAASGYVTNEKAG